MSSMVIPSYTVQYNTFCKPTIMVHNSSTIVACEFQDGVIIGADSQKSSGEYITNKNASKIIKIDDRIYCSGAGPEADIQFIIDSVMYQLYSLKLNKGGLSIAVVAGIFRELCYRHRDSVVLEFLIVGWDSIKKKGQICSISSGGMINQNSVCAIGSGSSYVYGYVDACYKTNMEKEEAEAFVAKTLQLAISRDNLSGGPVNLVAITSTGVSEVEVK